MIQCYSFVTNRNTFNLLLPYRLNNDYYRYQYKILISDSDPHQQIKGH